MTDPNDGLSQWDDRTTWEPSPVDWKMEMDVLTKQYRNLTKQMVEKEAAETIAKYQVGAYSNFMGNKGAPTVITGTTDFALPSPPPPLPAEAVSFCEDLRKDMGHVSLDEAAEILEMLDEESRE